MIKKYLIVSLQLLFFVSCKPLSQYQIYDMRCDNLTNPLGIGTINPYLSWKIAADQKGIKQKAYQILVATDSMLLEKGKADLWDSGKIESSPSVMILYQGDVLKARTLAYWKVGIWDDMSDKPLWSEVSKFSVGLLVPADWLGSYIGLPVESGNPENPLLKKQFEIAGSVQKTFLHVNSLGYHEIYINGNRVGDEVLSPSVSQFNKRSLAVTYDVTSHINEGRNDLIVWLGRGWYQPGLPGVVYDGPLVKIQMETMQDKKWNILFTSDTTWSCRESGYTGIGTWRPWQFGGEHVDASKLLPDFNAATLDEVTWLPVQEVAVPNHTVSPRMVEPNRIQEIIHPVKITQIEKDTWLVDMGKVLTGYAEINFKPLKEGQEIIVEYSDHLNEGELFKQNQIDQYVASGKEQEVFRNRFNYHGFQYMKISNLNTEPTLSDITAYLIHTDFKEKSSFTCSDPEMNAIHDMIQYTFRCLSLGGYLIDCPQIERLGYGGDGNASTQTAQTMFDLSPLYTNWMQAWADCIREDGGMPHTAPNPYTAGGGPYWCGFIITASWKTYINYGDSRLIEKYYPIMQQWLGYVEKYTKNDLLEKWPDLDYRGWYLGDWATPVGVDQTAKPSIDLVNNCFITECYGTMEKIALVLGKNTDANMYSKKKDTLQKRIQEHFFDNTHKRYGTGSQIDLVYPMLMHITPEELIPEVTKTLFTMTQDEKDGHLACGLVGIPVLTEWAIQNHSADWLYQMLKKKDYPSYLYMIENGATATWEHWNGERSRIHNCYNGIGAWFYQAIGGIRPDEKHPGYQKIYISPQIPEGITWSKVSKETPYGTLKVDWVLNEDKKLSIEITIPIGSTGILDFPQSVSKYIINGKEKQYIRGALNEIPCGKHTISYQWE